MRRILFRWRGFSFHAYPVLLYLGVVAGVIAGTRWAASNRLAAPRIYVAMLLLLPPALLGARLLFAVSHWRLYRSEPARIWRRSEGGAALYGGLLFAFLLSLPLLAAMKVSLLAFWDASSITMLVAMVFTRVGCLLNGCCSGRPADGTFTLCLPNYDGVWRRRLPAQLFEAGLAVLLLLGCLAVRARLPYPGILFFSAAGGYGLGRWLLEPTREHVDRIGAVSLHRAISAALFGISVLSFALAWRLQP